MPSKNLKKVYVTDTLHLMDMLAPTVGQDGAMYLVHAVDSDYAVNLLREVPWVSYVQSPEVATLVSAESKQNISSSDGYIPELKEMEGILYVSEPSEETELEDLSWYFIVLAHVAEDLSDVEEETEDEQECESCPKRNICFETDVEA